MSGEYGTGTSRSGRSVDRSGFAATTEIERLATEDSPGRTKPKVGPNEQGVLGKPALRRVGQEPRDHLHRGEAGRLGSLGKTLLGERGLVIEEVPVASADQSDVRLEDQDATSRGQQIVGDLQLIDNGIGGRKVFEVVAHEHKIEGAIRQDVTQAETVGLGEANVGRQVSPHVTQIHSPLVASVDVRDESATIAGDIQDTAVGGNVALQVSRQLAPDQPLPSGIFIAEAASVARGQVRHRAKHGRRMPGRYGPSALGGVARMDAFAIDVPARAFRVASAARTPLLDYILSRFGS